MHLDDDVAWFDSYLYTWKTTGPCASSCQHCVYWWPTYQETVLSPINQWINQSINQVIRQSMNEAFPHCTIFVIYIEHSTCNREVMGLSPTRCTCNIPTWKILIFSRTTFQQSKMGTDASAWLTFLVSSLQMKHISAYISASFAKFQQVSMSSHLPF